MAKYNIKEPDNLSKYEQLARIAFNLRYYTKIWQAHFGSDNRKLMARWEERLDKWIKENIEPDLFEETSEETALNIDETWQEIRPKQNKAI